MGDLAKIAELSASHLALLLALFLPGFLSIRIDRLIYPGDDTKAPELILDAIGFSAVNLGLLGWISVPIFTEISKASPDWFSLAYKIAILFVGGPIAWPLLFRFSQRFASRRGWLLRPYRFAFDDFFSRKQPCWIIVHLKDGSMIGGYFGDRSAASLAPASGHLYIEELWELDPQGKFLKRIGQSQGALFRPDDYQWIELFTEK